MENREIFDNKSILGDCNCVKQVSVVKRFDFFDEGLAFSMEREAERTIFGRGNAAWHRHRDDCICQRVVQMVRSMCNFCLFVCLFVYLFPPSLFLCFPPYFMFLLLLLLLFFFFFARPLTWIEFPLDVVLENERLSVSVHEDDKKGRSPVPLILSSRQVKSTQFCLFLLLLQPSSV